MAAPNIVQIAQIFGKTDVLSVTTTMTAITTCPTDKLYKINSLVVANIDTANVCDVTVEFFRSGVAYRIASTIAIPPDATLVVISKDMGIYLEEGDSLRIQASANSDLQAICSYEIIDDA